MEEENDRRRKESLFLQLLSSDLQYSVLFQKFPASVGVGISGACELPLAWRAHKPLSSALRSLAALALGRAMPRAPATELVFWHRVFDCAPKGCGLLFSFLSLVHLFVSFCFCLWL